jgi:hypothetical protein
MICFWDGITCLPVHEETSAARPVMLLTLLSVCGHSRPQRTVHTQPSEGKRCCRMRGLMGNARKHARSGTQDQVSLSRSGSASASREGSGHRVTQSDDAAAPTAGGSSQAHGDAASSEASDEGSSQMGSKEQQSVASLTHGQQVRWRTVVVRSVPLVPYDD